ncbi:MAG: hypothetical protein IBJ03_00245 [Gemmatimonadaceae bacterium]|nr:hypothetical protein [Gemmatimonadaceae bacterium]
MHDVPALRSWWGRANHGFPGLCVLLVTSVVLGTPGRAQAQTQSQGQTQRAPRPSSIEGVRLIVRPRVGDTLHLMVEQTVTSAARRPEPAASGTNGGAGTPPHTRRTERPTPEYGPRVVRANTRSTRIQLFARSLVEASDLAYTTLRAVTDSIVVGSGDAPDGARPVSMPVQGQMMRMKVTPDGAMRVIESTDTDADLGAALASIPGLLPAAPVSVGSEWTRDMRLPSLPVSGYRADGVVQVRLRLDSLTRNGRQAWISLDGKLHRDGAARDLPAGTRVVTAGTIQGHMRVDRERAWIMDARTVLDVQSEVAPGPAGTAAPMLLDIRIVQRVHVR